MSGIDFSSTECVANGGDDDEKEDADACREESSHRKRSDPTDFDSTECVINGANNRSFDGSDSGVLESLMFSSMEVVAGLCHDSLTTGHSRTSKQESPTAVEARMPCFPFPQSRRLSHGEDDRHIQVARHRSSVAAVQAIVVFLPGVNGGVGPCREHRRNFDGGALFPSLAQELSSHFPIDCYRLSWSHMQPTLAETVHAVCRAVLLALTVARAPISLTKMRVLLVGHSFGGGVAFQAAKELVGLCATLQAEVSGVATLATQWEGAADGVKELKVPKLIVHGIDDTELSCGISLALHNHAVSPRELHLVESCDHHFTGRKAEMLLLLKDWIVKHSACSPNAKNRNPSDTGPVLT